MKRMFFWAVCSMLLLTLYGCPDATKFSLGKQSEHKIDTDLVGTWQCTEVKDSCGVYRATIKKQTDYLYNVKVDEWGEMWSYAEASEYTGWITKVGDMTFLCLDGTDSDELYALCIEKNGKKQFSIFDVPNDDYITGGTESTQAFRDDVTKFYWKKKRALTPFTYSKQ